MLKFVFEFIKKSKTFYLLCFVSVISSVLGILLPYINGKFVDVLIVNNNIKVVYVWGFWLFVFGTLNVWISYIYNLKSQKYITNTIYSLNQNLISHVWQVGYKQISKYNMSYLMQRIYSDSNITVNFFINNFVALIINTVSVLVLLIVLLKINKYYLLLSLIFSLIYIIAFDVVGKKLTERSLACKNSSNEYYSELDMKLKNYEDIKIEMNFDDKIKILNKSFSNFMGSFVPFLKISQQVTTVEGTISLLFQISSFIIGGIQVMNNKMSIGEFTIVNSYFVILLSCIKYYFNFAKEYKENVASYERIKEIFDLPLECLNYKSDIPSSSDIAKIELNKISFSYGNKILFDNFNETFCKNEIVAIVGGNGAGKSTLLKIIIGLLEPDFGEIVFNGFKTIDLDWYEFRKKRLSYSAYSINEEKIQISEIFFDIDMSLLSDYSKTIFDDKEFVNKVYNKRLCDLSLGEKSKVLVLRALCKNKEIIILDEPTSNMDSDSINALKTYLNNIKQDKIIICATHDSSIINIATKIVKI